MLRKSSTGQWYTPFFIYPLFVAAVETFNLGVFRFLNFETMKSMGLIFMIITLIFFPLSYFADSLFTKGADGINQLGRKLMFSEIAKMAMAETITLFGSSYISPVLI